MGFDEKGVMFQAEKYSSLCHINFYGKYAALQQSNNKGLAVLSYL